MLLGRWNRSRRVNEERILGRASLERPCAGLGLALSRLKWPQAYPVVFPGVVFCLAGRMGDFSMTGRDMGESGIPEIVESPVFSFTLTGRALSVVDRLRFRACSERFLFRRTFSD
jgi:hypothetical protein